MSPRNVEVIPESIYIVGEDLSSYLIIWQEAESGSEGHPGWVEKDSLEAMQIDRWQYTVSSMTAHLDSFAEAGAPENHPAHDSHSIYIVEGQLYVAIPPLVHELISALDEVIKTKYPTATAHRIPVRAPAVVDDSKSDGGRVDSPMRVEGEPECDDPTFAQQVQDHDEVFRCSGPHHGAHPIHSCAKCSEAAHRQLTTGQQNVADSGAFFPLCDSYGEHHLNTDQLSKPCLCIEPHTKCTKCIWKTLDRLATAKSIYRVQTERFGLRCYACSSGLHDNEKVSKCALCSGLAVRW